MGIPESFVCGISSVTFMFFCHPHVLSCRFWLPPPLVPCPSLGHQHIVKPRIPGLFCERKSSSSRYGRTAHSLTRYFGSSLELTTCSLLCQNVQYSSSSFLHFTLLLDAGKCCTSTECSSRSQKMPVCFSTKGGRKSVMYTRTFHYHSCRRSRVYGTSEHNYNSSTLLRDR
jgi:hypothetical protein